jgi:phospholipase C
MGQEFNGILGAKVVVLAACGLFFPISRVDAQGTGSIPIQHFIFIIQENHSFDNYFGTFPNADGIPPLTALPDYPGGPPVNQPFLTNQPSLHDLSHSWVSCELAYDDGAMDGFLWAEWPYASNYYGARIHTPVPDPGKVTIVTRPPVHRGDKVSPTPTPTPAAQQRHSVAGEVLSPHGFADDEDPDAPDIEQRNQAALASVPVASGTPNPENRPSWVSNTISYYDDSTIPNYWEYARRFTLCDKFFSSCSGPSTPNHLYLIAAQCGGLLYNLPGTEEAIYSFPSIVELLGGTNISWTYYVHQHDPSHETKWNPMPGFENYAGSTAVLSHLARQSQFFRDLQRGKLPQVCWLIPDADESEHPPANVQTGMWYVTNLINAVMQSQYWNSCAIILLWDDSGGFYDHVPPIQVDNFGYGFRVPALVISPYSVSGAIVRRTYDQTSTLRLVEATFGLSPLTDRDRDANNMLDCFNFSQTPLPPLVIPTPTPSPTR